MFSRQNGNSIRNGWTIRRQQYLYLDAPITVEVLLCNRRETPVNHYYLPILFFFFGSTNYDIRQDKRIKKLRLNRLKTFTWSTKIFLWLKNILVGSGRKNCWIYRCFRCAKEIFIWSFDFSSVIFELCAKVERRFFRRIRVNFNPELSLVKLPYVAALFWNGRAVADRLLDELAGKIHLATKFPRARPVSEPANS